MDSTMPSASDIDKVQNMARLIADIGPVAVILAVFLMLFMVVIFAILKSFIDNQAIVQKHNEELMNTIISSFDKIVSEEENHLKETKPYDEKNMVEIFVKLNRTFKLDCKKYLEKTNSDRIGIYVFHNGSHSSHGLPFFKVSCISEYIRRGCGIISHFSDCNSVPLTLFDDIIDRLYSYGFVIVKNSYNGDTPSTASGSIQSKSFYLDKDMARTAIFCAVYDSYENILAFIMLEYINEIDDNDIDNYINELKEFCARIRPTLEFSGYNNIDNKEGEN